MIKAAVIGHPIAHSKSPLIHGYWIKTYGLEGSYTAIDIVPEELEMRIAQMVGDGYAGFNVTIPHKQAIMKLCATLSEEAQAIGAVNTVVIDAAGHLHGHNTDGYGFTQNLLAHISDFDWCHAPCVVLGAGGAARAILHALKTKGVPHIAIVNRTFATAQKLGDEFGVHAHPWERRHDLLAKCALLVNTTALGMAGKDPLDICLDTLPSSAVVYDIVYAPLMTELLQSAQARGNKIVTGIGMLLHQARPAFRHWFGTMPDVTPELLKLIL